MGRRGVGHERHRGDFHHDPDRRHLMADAASRQLGRNLGDPAAQGTYLGHRGDHGQHQPDLGAGRSSQDCSHLRFEYLGKLAVQAGAAHTEERVLLRGDAQVGRGLVPADIKCPDHHGFGEAGTSKGVEVELLVLSGGIGPVEKQEFRAKQTDAFGCRCDGAFDVIAGSHVGGHLDPMLPEGHAHPAELLRGSNGCLEGLTACREGLCRDLGRADDDVTRRAIDGDWVACPRALDNACGTHHRRDAK